ncbi:MAG: FkbM family methyltransferase [Vulcanisaeta sp.]
MGILSPVRWFRDGFRLMVNGQATYDVLLYQLLSMRPFSFLPKPRAVKLPDGFRIYVNDEATLSINVVDHYVRREYMWHDNYIPRRGWIVVDAGAYVGIYTLWASKLVGDSGFVIAFEPNPLAYAWLIRNIEVNNARNIRALPYALGDETTYATLHIAKENIEASSLIPNHITNNPSGNYTIINAFKVPVITLDFIISRSGLFIGRGIDRIDLVKIDVEGYEMRVLMGSEKLLGRGLIERFVIEVHKDQVRTIDVINYLSDYGYRPVGVKHFDHVKDVAYIRLTR